MSIIENEKEAATTVENESLRAEVESRKVENESLKAELAKMTTDRDEHAVEVARLNAVIADLKAEGDKEQDNAAPEAEKPSGLNPEILSAIKARLAGGDPKSAIIKDYVGMVVDGKSLTEYAVKKYITAASAE